jgi:superfamily II DNA or RNA helicase
MTSQTLHHVTGRLSLRPPQAESLARFEQALDAAPEMLGHKRDVSAILATLKAEFPTLDDFEREFPSLCFALATGVGKTRLMGAFIAYLHLAHGINNFFVLAPNLTIYNKLIADFTRNTPKYVFKGIAEFAQQAPLIITGDNYDQTGAAVDAQPQGFAHDVRINIFNISKINSEVRGGKEPRIKRMREVLGDSYFNHLANLPDLVLLMDESHRYRAQAGMRAINELKPRFGLEVTATPFVESGKGPVPFKNVVMDYPLARALEDGFVKEPAAVTQRNFSASAHTPPELEKIKLEDGVRLHETTKVELLTYARENGVAPVKPFMLVIARDTTHAGELKALIESGAFYEGRYAGKVIQVDSSRTGAQGEEMIARLLAVESTDEPTEIVIHVNMLKEGWDVTNLYTIVPLRAANIARQAVCQRDDFACALQRSGMRQHAHLALLDGVDLLVDARLLGHEPVDAAEFVGVFGKPGQGFDDQRQAAFGCRGVRLHQTRDKADGLGGGGGKFVFFLRRACGKAPLQITTSQPTGHISLRRLGKVPALNAKLLQIPADPLVKNGSGQTALALVKMGLQQTDDARPVVRGQQAPQGLRPHAPIGGDGFVCFHILHTGDHPTLLNSAPGPYHIFSPRRCRSSISAWNSGGPKPSCSSACV